MSDLINTQYFYGFNTPNLVYPSFKADSTCYAYTPTFQAVPQNKQNPQQVPSDSVQFSAEDNIKKKKKPFIVKLAIGLGAVGVAVVGAKHGTNAYFRNFCKKNLTRSNLAENIVFKEAKNLDDALKYTRGVLKIKNIDGDYTLEALNYTNKALTDISNLHKGKAFLPKSLTFKDFEGEAANALAAVNISPSKEFGNLQISKNFLNEEKIDKYLKEKLFKKDGSRIYKDSMQIMKNSSGNAETYSMMSNELYSLSEKYYKNPKSLTLSEKLDLRNSFSRFDDYCSDFISKNEKAAEVKHKVLKKPLISGYETIYHELGHLQDIGINMPKMGYGWIRQTSTKDQVEYLKPFKKIITNSTARDFMTNQQIQDVAEEVSIYAKEGVGEFVAETYAGLASGRKFSQKVMDLYNKYGGPAVS